VIKVGGFGDVRMWDGSGRTRWPQKRDFIRADIEVFVVYGIVTVHGMCLCEASEHFRLGTKL